MSSLTLTPSAKTPLSDEDLHTNVQASRTILRSLIRKMKRSGEEDTNPSLYLTLLRLQQMTDCTDKLFLDYPRSYTQGTEYETFPFNSYLLWNPNRAMSDLVSTLHQTPITLDDESREAILFAIDSICQLHGMPSGEGLPSLLSNFDTDLKVQLSKWQRFCLGVETRYMSKKEKAESRGATGAELSALEKAYRNAEDWVVANQCWEDHLVATQAQVRQVEQSLEGMTESTSVMIVRGGNGRLN